MRFPVLISSASRVKRKEYVLHGVRDSAGKRTKKVPIGRNHYSIDIQK